MPCTVAPTSDRVPPKGWELCPCSGFMPIALNKDRVNHVKSMCHQRWLGEEIKKKEAEANLNLPCITPPQEQ